MGNHAFSFRFIFYFKFFILSLFFFKVCFSFPRLIFFHISCRFASVFLLYFVLFFSNLLVMFFSFFVFFRFFCFFIFLFFCFCFCFVLFCFFALGRFPLPLGWSGSRPLPCSPHLPAHAPLLRRCQAPPPPPPAGFIRGWSGGWLCWSGESLCSPSGYSCGLGGSCYPCRSCRWRWAWWRPSGGPC